MSAVQQNPRFTKQHYGSTYVSTYYTLANLYVGKYEITVVHEWQLNHVNDKNYNQIQINMLANQGTVCESSKFCSSSGGGGGGSSGIGSGREHLNPTILFHFSLLAKVLKLVHSLLSVGFQTDMHLKFFNNMNPQGNGH
jgi:hypothetical protein